MLLLLLLFLTLENYRNINSEAYWEVVAMKQIVNFIQQMFSVDYVTLIQEYIEPVVC